MSDAFWVALFAGLPGIIAAIAAAYGMLQNQRLRVQVQEVHDATNGLVQKLISTTDTEAHARGVADESARERASRKGVP